MEKSLAQEYFDYCQAESQLDDALMTAFGADPNNTATWPAGDFGYDWYDYSFELWGTRDDFEPTDEQLDAVWALGFARGWICYRDGTEMYVSGHKRGERVQRSHGRPEDKREARQWRRQREELEAALATMTQERDELKQQISLQK